jgi:hypothetical protein
MLSNQPIPSYGSYLEHRNWINCTFWNIATVIAIIGGKYIWKGVVSTLHFN